jgi:hypothetical protein
MIELLAGAGIGAVASLAGAYINYLDSEEARKLTAKERAKIENQIQMLQAPNFSPADFTPDMYKVAAKYIPKQAKLIEEVAPTLVKADSADAKSGRAAEKAALSALMQKGQSGKTMETEMLLNQATQAANAQNRMNEASLRESLARQGVSPGSGQELNMRMSENASSASNAAQASQNTALELERQRLQALMQGAQLGGNIRQADVGVETTNADFINQFNNRVANRANQNEQFNVGNINDAEKFNVGNTQRVADANVGLTNQAKADVRNNEWNKYNADVNKTSLLAGQGANKINDIRSDAAAKAGMVSAATGAVSDVANAAGNAYAANEQNAEDRAYRRSMLDALARGSK